MRQLKILALFALVAATYASGYGSGRSGYSYGYDSPIYEGYSDGYGGYGSRYDDSSAHTRVTAAVYGRAGYSGQDGYDVDYVDPNPRYQYNYKIRDPYTGDDQTKHETRDGGRVYGEYSVVDPDGTKRIVTYTADDYSGFKAVVRRVPYYAAAHGSGPAHGSGASVSHQEVVRHHSEPVPVRASSGYRH